MLVPYGRDDCWPDQSELLVPVNVAKELVDGRSSDRCDTDELVCRAFRLFL